MRVVLLGTNGWFDTETGNTISLLIEERDWFLVLDAGMGIRRLDQYVGTPRPGYLFLSHFHLDHSCGIHLLGKFNCASRLTVFGQPGIEQHLGLLFNRPYTVGPAELPYPVAIQAVEGIVTGFPFAARTLPLVHSDPVQGLRVESGGRVIAYVPDTGYCENAVTLARGADLLFAECAYRPGEERPAWPHLNPESAARIAREAGARRLVLVHFDARNYPTLEARREAEIAARAVFPESTAGMDGMEIEC